MFVNNLTKKTRVFRIDEREARTPEARDLWGRLYAIQSGADNLHIMQRLAHFAKRRDPRPPRLEIDPCLRIELRPGTTEIPDEFAEFAVKVLAGEVAFGSMSVSGVPAPKVCDDAEKDNDDKKEKPGRVRGPAKADQGDGGTGD